MSWQTSPNPSKNVMWRDVISFTSKVSNVDLSTKFRKINRKTPKPEPLFNKLAEACNFIKKRLWRRYFSVNIAKFLRTPFLQNTSGRPLQFMAAPPSESLWLKVWESLLKLSKTLAMMKHYKKMFLMTQFLRKSFFSFFLSLFWFFLKQILWSECKLNYNLLINYLNLIKEPMQKQLLTGVVFFRITFFLKIVNFPENGQKKKEAKTGKIFENLGKMYKIWIKLYKKVIACDFLSFNSFTGFILCKIRC